MYLLHTLKDMAYAPIEWILAVIRHRGLFKEFFSREIHGRFAGSMGGSFWLLVTPLSQILIYSFVFSVVLKIRLSRQEVGTGSFVLFLLAGLFPWMAFSEGLTRCTGILIENANIITKVVLPIELLPTVGLSASFFVNGVGMSLFVVYLMWAHFLSWTWLWLSLLILLFFLFALGLAAFLSALCVFLRDTQQILPIIIFIWFYLTPIIYPISMIPSRFHVYLYFNPVFPFIALFQGILLNQTMDPRLLGIAAIWTLVSLFFGTFFFERLRHSFADVL
ncbi:MAG: ABC transporter permease [Nitrospiraceae bacterium]|nr:ABC transporter permease [Nitrospiraceae bacterium]